MKLTKLQRHTAYIIMLAEFEANREMFLCNAACHLSLIQNNEDYFLKPVLPELWNKKPLNQIYENCWFPIFDKQSRIDILKRCIEETY